MSTPDVDNHTNSPPQNNLINLHQLQCEIKLVNNWKKLQLRSRFRFSEIDPIEIKAMMINYYSIYCPLETKIEFYEYTHTFSDIPNLNTIISFLKNQSKYKIFEAFDDKNDKSFANNAVLSILIELPLLVLPITKQFESNGNKYYFYGFANGKLLLFHNSEEMNHVLSLRMVNGKNKIFYKDILSLFVDSENYSFAHPKNTNLELSLFEECNIYRINEIDLEIIHKPHSNDNRCVICLSSIQYEIEEFCRISCCKHMYHYDCIENLIKYSNDNQCPLCRSKIKYVQYLHLPSINKIFKIKNTALHHISHNHYFNKYYFSKKTNDTCTNNENESEFDEKEGISTHQIPNQPCLGFINSIPSPTHSNSSISIPPTRHSSPSSTPDIAQLRLNENNANAMNNNSANNNNGSQSNNGNNNNNGNATNATKSLGYFDTNFYDKNAGEDD